MRWLGTTRSSGIRGACSRWTPRQEGSPTRVPCSSPLAWCLPGAAKRRWKPASEKETQAMPKPFHDLTVDQFVDLLDQFPFRRRINAVHMHHTWRPNHAQFGAREPLAVIEAMWEFHTGTN